MYATVPLRSSNCCPKSRTVGYPKFNCMDQPGGPNTYNCFVSSEVSDLRSRLHVKLQPCASEISRALANIHYINGILYALLHRRRACLETSTCDQMAAIRNRQHHKQHNQQHHQMHETVTQLGLNCILLSSSLSSPERLRVSASMVLVLVVSNGDRW